MVKNICLLIAALILALAFPALAAKHHDKHVIDPPPTLGTDCGNATISSVSTDNAGKVTIGSTTSSTDCTLTFDTSKTNPPSCFAGDETSFNPVQTAATTTTLHLFSPSPWSTGDSVAYGCVQP